jgi:hypothetical protein
MTFLTINKRPVNLRKALLKHIAQLLLLKLPTQLLGILILPVVCIFFELGKFPRFLRAFDDVRARTVIRHHNRGDIHFGYNNFGARHMELFNKYNSNFVGRYIWAAFRNAVNGFQHYHLGLRLNDIAKIWQLNSEFKLFGSVYFRYHLGYKFYSLQHAEHMEEIDIPLQWVFSTGIRRH